MSGCFCIRFMKVKWLLLRENGYFYIEVVNEHKIVLIQGELMMIMVMLIMMIK